MLTAPLWAAVALSLGIEPGNLPGANFAIDEEPFESCPPEFRRRWDIAHDHARTGAWCIKFDLDDLRAIRVDLAGFHTWALRLGWRLPELFPHEPTDATDGVESAGEPPEPRSARGPRPGLIDRYGDADRELFPLITRLVREEKLSPSAAARRLAEAKLVAGTGTAESRASRLAKAYRVYEDAQTNRG